MRQIDGECGKRPATRRDFFQGRSSRRQRVMRKVVNISSVSGVYGNAGQIGYGAGPR